MNLGGDGNLVHLIQTDAGDAQDLLEVGLHGIPSTSSSESLLCHRGDQAAVLNGTGPTDEYSLIPWMPIESSCALAGFRID